MESFKESGAAGGAERAWRAAKASAGAIAGPAGMAVGASLLAGAAYAVGALIAPQALSEGLKSAHAWPVLVAGMGAAAGAMGSLAAAAGGFKQGLKESGPATPPLGLKESLLDAWRSAKAHMIHGPAALGLTAFAAGASALAASPELAASWFGGPSVGAPLSAVSGFLCVPFGAAAVMATLAAVMEPGERAIEMAAAALGSEKGKRLRAERVEIELDEADFAAENPSPLRLLLSKLTRRREAEAAKSQATPSGPKGPGG